MAGLLAIRYLKSLANGRGETKEAIHYAETVGKGWDYGQKDIIVSRLKSDISGLDLSSVGDGTNNGSNIALDFLAALRPMTITGRMNLRRVPRAVTMLTQLTGSVASWVGNGGARRLSAGTYAREHIELLSVAAMTVASNELLNDNSMDGENELLRDLLAGCALALDSAFIDPANSGITNVTPASITSGTSPIEAMGSTIADCDQALATAVQQAVAAGSDLKNVVVIMSPDLAAGMALARGASGAPAYPYVKANGGTLLGLPVLTSVSVAQDSDGLQLILADASQITFAEGQPNLAISRNASIQLSDSPSASTTTPIASATLTSMFQCEATALLASMACNWRLRHDDCVQVITGLPSMLDAT